MTKKQPSPQQLEAARAKKQAIMERYEASKTTIAQREPELQQTLEQVQQALMASASEQFPKISLNNFAFVLFQMEAQHLEGLPYTHVRTFEHWKDNNRTVRKGEKSTLVSITWVPAKETEDGKKGRLFPKVTHLFHVNQTDEIGAVVAS
ncbi:MAG: ArdC-like ssDNA-binding domain-containing protein [Stenomitos frigidus ULC029]